MTHLGLGSSLEEPWLDLWGGVREGGLPGRLCRPPGKVEWVEAWGEPSTLPSTLPVCPRGLVLCPAWDALWGYWRLGKNCFFPCGTGPGLRGVRGELLASEGSCIAPGGELLPSPGGR